MAVNKERAGEPVALLEGVSFIRNGNCILRDVSLSISRGERWVLLGPNGSGKSSLVSLLAGYEWPSQGRVSLLGAPVGQVDLQQLRSRLAIFQPLQQSMLDYHYPGSTVLDVLLTGSDGTIACYRDPPTTVVERARKLYESSFPGARSFDLKSSFNRLSSGERRKVLLLRLFMADPELVVLDEPYESLDIPSRLELQGILARLAAGRAMPILTVLHRVEEIAPFNTHILLLKGGQVLIMGEIDDILNSRNLSNLYDHPLHAGRQDGHCYCLPHSGSETDSS